MPISHRGTDSGLLNGRLLQQAPLTEQPHGIPTPKGYGLYHDPYVGDDSAASNHLALIGESGTGFHLVSPEGKDKGYRSDHTDHGPLQGTLFSPHQFRDTAGPMGKAAASRRGVAVYSHAVGRGDHSPHAGGTWTNDQHFEAASPVREAMRASTMPSELIEALRGLTKVNMTPMEVGGTYYGSDVTTLNDRLNTPELGERPHIRYPGPIVVQGNQRMFHDGVGVSSRTVRHELGHRADYRSNLAEPNDSLTTGEQLAKVSRIAPGIRHPNPRLEGIADGFADRYSIEKDKINEQRTHATAERDLQVKGGDLGPRPVGEFSHYQSTGYSSSPMLLVNGPLQASGKSDSTSWHSRHGWTAADRALYTAMRGHFSKTGENPTAGGSVSKSDSSSFSNPDRSLLAKMSMTSPHAVQALEDNSTPYNDLNAESKYARDAYTMSRQVGTQFSLFSEHSAESPSGSRYIGMSINPNAVPHDEQDLSGIRSALLPGERIRTRSMDKPVHDIPDDFKPTPEAEQAINAIRNPPKKMER